MECPKMKEGSKRWMGRECRVRCFAILLLGLIALLTTISDLVPRRSRYSILSQIPTILEGTNQTQLSRGDAEDSSFSSPPVVSVHEGDEEELPHQCTLRPVEMDVVKEKLLVLKEKWKHGRMKAYVQHMHKSGGTTLCYFFSKSALRVPRECNCNGNPSFVPYTRGDAQSMNELFEMKPYQVYFNEGPMFRQPLDTSHFIFLTSIRKPHYRVISQLLHAWKGKYRYLEDGVLDGLEELLKTYMDHGSLQGKLSNYIQNMQTLHMLGRSDVQDLNVAYEQAVDRLFEFALTIPTDEMDQGLKNLEKLIYPNMRPSENKSRLNIHDAASQVEFLRRRHPALLASLKQQNLYDQCLYHQARALHKAQTEVLRGLQLD